MLYLALALDDEETFFATQRRLLLQGYDVLDTGVLDAGDNVFFHISTAKIRFFLRQKNKRNKNCMFLCPYV